MEKGLESKFRMPKQTLQGRQYVFINVRNQSRGLGPVNVVFLNKVSVFSEELTDVVDATEYNFGLKGNYYFD